jgi:hypothetical protein
MASLKHSTRILYVSDDQDDIFLLQVVAEGSFVTDFLKTSSYLAMGLQVF